jgi:RHS repeat-associated protein
MSKRILLVAAAFFFGFVLDLRAQDETPTTVTVQNRSGDLPFSASIGTELEHVDVASGNLIVHIPFTSVKGRGMDFDFGLNYDARYWIAGTRQFANQQPEQIWNIGLGNYLPDATSGLGWQPNQGHLTWTNLESSCTLSGQISQYFTDHYIYHDPQGGNHPLAILTADGTCDDGSWVVNVSQGPDLSGAGMYAGTSAETAPPSIYEANGTLLNWMVPGTCSSFRPPGVTYSAEQCLLGVFTDANGNTLQQYPGGLDTLGRNIVTQQNGTGQILYKIYDSSGTQQTYTVNYASIALHTAFNASDQYGAIQEYIGNRNVITSIVLPSGRSYSFQYETGSFGAITRIDLPTGAYVTYTWGTAYTSGGGDHAFRYVTSRTLHTDGQTFTWNITVSCGCTSPTTTVTDPFNQQSVYNVTNGTITTAKIYSGSAAGTSLRQYDILYNVYPFYQNGNTDETSLRLPSRVTTTLENNLVTKKEYDYDTFNYSYPSCSDIPNGNSGCVHDDSGNVYYGTNSATRGNVIEMREYDWGAGAPGPLLRRTKNAYLHDSNSNYLTYNIVNKVLTQTVCNGTVTCAGNGDQAAQTQYEYDNYVAGDNPLQSAANAAEHDDTNFSSTFIYRGNLTRAKRWRNTDGALLTTTYSYDTLGNVRAIKDPLSHITTYDYTDSFANTACPLPAGKTGQAYVSQVTNALTQHIQVVRYPCTGLVQAHKDQNDISGSRAGTTYTYDLLGRPTQKNNPDGGQIATAYNDLPPVSVTSTTKITSAMNLTTATVKDGLGRSKQSQLTSDPQGTVFTDTTYDALGRVATVSNPYRTGSDPTTSAGTTTYAYDALGRKITETYPDGSVLTTVYCGPTTLVTDPTGRWRRSTTDALGRLVEVDEPNAPGASVNSNGCPGTGEPIWVTSYTNDTLGNLTQIVQNGSRQRNFTYDSLSHLLTANNPETGQITYAYNNDGMLISKTDGRNMTTNYSPSESPIDAIHRVTKISYSNGDSPTIHTYDQGTCLGLSTCDNIGHLTSRTDAAGTEAWSNQIDAANHRTVHVNQRATSNITKTATYYLDLAGNVFQSVYPTGRTVNYTYDTANRPATAADSANSITYATGFQTAQTGCVASAVCYTPQGTFYALSIGQSSSFTGLNLTHSYNSRFQPLEFKASSTGGNAIDITYNFVDPASGHNAGHVYGITNNLDSTRSQTFSYDQLNRITAAQTTSTYSTSPTHCWGEIYNPDAWGNLQSIAATTNPNYIGCIQESGFIKTADSNNHLSGFTYDASGNTQNDGVNSYTWNAESQLTSAGGVNYLYDGDGRRVSKVGSKFYWYGSGGDILAETDASGNTTAEYIFFGGKRIAMLPYSGVPPVTGAPIYYIEDLLGTSRVTTTNTGVVCYDADFYPYGGERSYTNTCPQNYKFEGKERDTETGNDDFGARYYSNRFGRWLSADWSTVPAPVPYANLTNPQTLNLYAMVADDPESFADLDGHDCRTFSYVITVCWNLSEFESLQTAERSHEFQHRQDSKNGVKEPGWKKEQRGWAAERPTLELRLTELEDKEKNGGLTDTEKREKREVQDELERVKSFTEGPEADRNTQRYYRDNQLWIRKLFIPDPDKDNRNPKPNPKPPAPHPGPPPDPKPPQCIGCEKPKYFNPERENE